MSVTIGCPATLRGSLGRAVRDGHLREREVRTDTPWIFTNDGVAVKEKTAPIQGQTPLHEFHVPRHRLIERLLREAESNPSVEAMRRIMRDYTPPSPVCKHLDQMPEDYPLATLYSFLLVPRTGEYYFWVTRPGPEYPCTFERTPQRFSFE